MKRLMITIAFACCSIASVRADVVLEKTAKEIASRFFFGADAPVSDKLVAIGDCQGAMTKSSSLEASPFHIFNNTSGGFVIISGDNTTRPVLAYSYEKNFDRYDIQDNVRWWLDMMAAAVRSNREKGVEPDESTIGEWARVGLASKAGTEVVNLHTVEWAQESPFNTGCPIISSKNALTGCVPIAICELMTYYGYPEKGKGDIPSYQDEKGVTRTGYSLGTVYNWAELQKLTTVSKAEGASSSVKSNLATLVKDVGYAVQATYGTNETSAATERIITLVAPLFGYNKAASLEHRSNYLEQAWFNLLKTELDEGRPILYSGQNTEGGHQYLIDGYDDSGLVHINFGWGGNRNGYYWVGTKYYADQMAITGMVPDPDGTSTSIPGDVTLFGYDKEQIISVTGTVGKDKTFTVTTCYIRNDKCSAFNGLYKYVHTDKDGVWKEDLHTSPVGINLEPMYFFTFTRNCTAHMDFAFGDRIEIYVKRNDESTWRPIRTSKDGSMVCSWNYTPYPFIDASASYKVGDMFFLKLKNNSFQYVWTASYRYCNSISWDFYLNGEYYTTVSSPEARFYVIPEPGRWTVRANVENVNGLHVQNMTASFNAVQQ